MRIFLGHRNQRQIEHDKRILKFNYGSRKGYSIEEVLLEKRLLCDISIRDCHKMVHAITNLELCYDQQLCNMASMVEESVGIDCNGMKLIAKVLPILNHYVCTGFGMSKGCYRDEMNVMGETR